jgi:xeroderma pigmentosum group C-complementing protein
VTPRKPTLFDDLDAGTAAPRSVESSKALLKKLVLTDDEESSLSSLSSDEFEDVPIAKRQNTDEDEDEEDEDIEFEDVETHGATVPSGPEPSGDLELTLVRDTRISLTNPLGTKKGPSKIERGIRTHTHQMHVMSLMWANSVRNGWLCDKELQETLVKQSPKSVTQAVDKWKRDTGLQQQEEVSKATTVGRGENVKGKKADSRSQRDWGEPAERLASGHIDMSHGDPLYRLLEFLMSYWKQRFRITAPGLRKIGYLSLENLDAVMKSMGSDPKTGTFDWAKHDTELHGERIENIEEFRQCAKSMEGSRDVSSQLFTALLRGLGLEARMVASLQPLGFGWSQSEEGNEKNPRRLKKKKEMSLDFDTSDEASEGDEEEPKPTPKSSNGKGKGAAKARNNGKSDKYSGRRKSQVDGEKDISIDLSESKDQAVSSSDESVVDITPAKPRVLPSLPYDKDLIFPHYWTEVLSTVTNTYIPVDPVVLRLVATNPESFEKFEVRGGKAEKAKQVTAYIVGHSPDGTAKDVTTRYLKRHVWPGRTKGYRLPVEKVPIYNHKGKVKRHEEYDWFKTVMSGYARGTRVCPRTEIDDHEEATILKRVKPEKKVVEEGKETLQSYKMSTEYVLERHLLREEALVPDAEHVKTFTIKGKGKDGNVEEKVFRRKDVVKCKSMETWHKEGRAPIPGEEPLKRVPYRVATTNRRRELAEAEHATGQKSLQGLYSEAQTDWIIPPPIENGIIPKNSFGNIDLYVDSMLPEGAAHIPRRGTVKICKRLGIDYAEAVTGFEFGHRMAVPIITGVVIAEEHEQDVMDEWVKDEAERIRKEDEKRAKAALNMWRKMLMGMRIIERVREEYGNELDDNPDANNPWTNKKRKEVDIDAEAQARIMAQQDEDMAGGFLPEGHEEEEPDIHHSSGFFPAFQEGDEDDGDGFVVEGHDEPVRAAIGQNFEFATLQSIQPNGKAMSSVDGDEETKDVDSELEAPLAKKRGRPSASLNASTKPRSKPIARKAANPVPDSSSDEETENIDSEVSLALPKKRGRPSGLANKLTTPKPRASARKRPGPKTIGKRKIEIKDSEQDEDEDEDEEVKRDEDIKVEKKAAGRRATLPARTQSTRKTPRRNVATKSKYFEHDDDDDDDNE